MSRRLREFVCAHCGDVGRQPVSAVNRAMREGLNIYCDRRCAGLGRRKSTSPEEKKRRKAEYDKKRRAQLGESLLKARRDAYYANHAENLRKQAAVRARRASDPDALAAYRSQRKAIRERPGWKEHKRAYDRRYRAEKEFGPEWAEAFLVLRELYDEVNKRFPERQDLYIAKGNYNKAQTRKREHKCRRTHSTQST